MHASRPERLRCVAILSVLVLLSLGLMAPSSASAADLVANGDFETPDAGSSFVTYGTGSTFGGWSVDAGSVDHTGRYWTAASGQQSVDVDGNEAGAVSQSLATIPGARYRVAFALAGNPECGDAVKQLRVDWDGTPLGSVSFDTSGTSTSNMGWQRKTFGATALDSSTSLSFTSLTPGACGPAIDLVSVVRLKPQIAVTSASTLEGDTGTHAEEFSVSLSQAANTPVTVKYATANGTATAGSDYTAIPSTTLTFNPGQTQKTVNVSVTGDTVNETSQSYSLKLSDASSNAAIVDNAGTGTIVDDEGPVWASIDDDSAAEGDSGSSGMGFTVSLSRALGAGESASVNWATVAGTATAGSDYTEASGAVSFGPGERQKFVSVDVIGDTSSEPNEVFSVKLSAPTSASGLSVVLADVAGRGTIVNDDGTSGPAPGVPVSVSDAWTVEGDAGSHGVNFTVAPLSVPQSPVSVKVATANGGATAGSDYVAVPATTLSWGTGDAVPKTVAITVNGDTVNELSEAFTVRLSSPSGMVLADGAGVGTIADEEGPLFAYVADAITNERNAGTSAEQFTVRLSGTPAPGQSVSVPVSTAPCTSTSTVFCATAGIDFTSVGPTTLTFTAATGLTRSVSVPIAGDLTVEPDEVFRLNLGTPSGLVVADNQATGTIVNED